MGVGTASRAISGKGSVAAGTLDRVLSAVEQLKFHPSSAARSLALRESGVIGVCVPVFDGSFYSPLLDRIHFELHCAGRQMMTVSGIDRESGVQGEIDAINLLVQRECDGLIAINTSLTDSQFHDLQKRTPRTVVLNRIVPGLESNCFGADHYHAGQLAARALLSRGHRRIAAIHGTNYGPDIQLRMAGFISELALANVALVTEYLAGGRLNYDAGFEGAQALLKAGTDEVSAVFCANDVMAMAAIQCFSQAGLRIPQDLSILGYDDADVAKYTTPSLSTIHIPIREFATNGVRHLLNLCYGTNLPVVRHFQPLTVWRNSVSFVP